jgi:hypothetical protein
MVSVQKQTDEDYKMDEGHKRVLAIVAGIWWRLDKGIDGSADGGCESARGAPDLIRGAVGRSNQEKE